ncbi:MAG: DUF1730 domain-containing protein, partial [Deltaproteobacteria bacterium]|nr:DUF1730 domain-containing protein [Deltaproteobacteria bacterium]
MPGALDGRGGEDFFSKAYALGFARVGVAPAGRPPYLEAFQEWIAEGRHGGMTWIERHRALRADPGTLLPGCRAVITLAFPYSSKKPATPDGFTMARYTRPRDPDYHRTLRDLCRDLAREVVLRYPGSRCRVCVDSAPVLERSFAWAAGIGFWGKNNMLIIPDLGSYFFLAEILTTAPLEFPRAQPMESLCGSCTRCLDACPTGALGSDLLTLPSNTRVPCRRGPAIAWEIVSWGVMRVRRSVLSTGRAARETSASPPRTPFWKWMIPLSMLRTVQRPWRAPESSRSVRTSRHWNGPNPVGQPVCRRRRPAPVFRGAPWRPTFFQSPRTAT